jgi:hypothetical protein
LIQPSRAEDLASQCSRGHHCDAQNRRDVVIFT